MVKTVEDSGSGRLYRYLPACRNKETDDTIGGPGSLEIEIEQQNMV